MQRARTHSTLQESVVGLCAQNVPQIQAASCSSRSTICPSQLADPMSTTCPRKTAQLSCILFPSKHTQNSWRIRCECSFLKRSVRGLWMSSQSTFVLALLIVIIVFRCCHVRCYQKCHGRTEILQIFSVLLSDVALLAVVVAEIRATSLGRTVSPINRHLFGIERHLLGHLRSFCEI